MRTVFPRAVRALLLCAILGLLPGCAALLPHEESQTQSAWQSFEEAQQVLDKVIVQQTTKEDLARLGIDPKSNPNITILNYSDILRRFIPSPSVEAGSLDAGVRECIAATTACIAYEIDRRSTRRQRYGSFLADFLNFRRKVDVVGWRFNAVILIKGDAVVYKLTGGQPLIREHEETTNPLGPFQGWGPRFVGP